MRDIIRIILAVAALHQIAAWPAMTASPPMQRETVALSFKAVLPITLVCWLRRHLRCRRTAGDKGRQALDVAVLVLGCGVLQVTAAETRLLTGLKELRITRQIGLRIPGTERRLLAHAGQAGWLVIPLVADIVTQLVAPVDSALAAEEGTRLPELLLRCGNEAEIMLGVLEIVLGRNRISGGLVVTRKLQIFLRNVGRRASYFDVRSVRFIDPRERIVAFAVAPPHTLVLLVSHD